MRAQLLHLTGRLRGRTIAYDAPNVLVGTDPDAAVRYGRSTGVSPRHAEIAFVEEGCAFYLKPIGGRVFVNRNEVEECILEEGDLVEFGIDGPRVRFRIQVDPGRVCKPVRTMLRDARDVGRNSGAFAFTRSMSSDLLTHATWKLKVGVPLFVLVMLAIVFAAGWFGGGGQNGAYSEEIDRLRAQVLQLSRMQEVSQEQVVSLRGELAKSAEALDELRAQDAAVAKVYDVYTRAICLLHGRYGFRMPTGSDYVTDVDGTRLEIEYTGSGFRADKDGDVVTNRHVVCPWEYDEEAKSMMRSGFKPVMFRMTASFPGHEPVEVDTSLVRLRSDSLDVAVVNVVLEGIPVVELSEEDPTSLRGSQVLVVGYPAGVNALLAKADRMTVRSVIAGGPTLTQVIERLASHGAISPLVTAGRLGDVQAERLVYDAVTTSGGSGGPVFSRSGKVIAVNFAIMKEFAGSNFGVPVRYVRELLD